MDLPVQERPSRAALEARWLALTRVVLPGLARGQGWPVQLDHCFMRVCLDNALGRPWREVVRPPAYKHLPNEALRRAVALAERIADHPDLLGPLNEASLRLRGKRLPPRPGA